MIEKNLDQVVTAITFAAWENKQEILRKYVESVIDECVHKAEIKYIKGEHGAYVDKESITAVKSQL